MRIVRVRFVGIALRVNWMDSACGTIKKMSNSNSIRKICVLKKGVRNVMIILLVN